MSQESDFVDPIQPCMNPDFTFPSITSPGLPNFTVGCFLSTLAGINYALQWVPPTPENVPNISLPDISLFSSAFLSGITLPSSYPGFSYGPLTIPAVGSPPYKYNLSGEMELIGVCILLPYNLIVTFINGLLNLQVNIPTYSGIVAEFNSVCIGIGLNTPSVSQFGGCLASSMENLFSSLL